MRRPSRRRRDLASSARRAWFHEPRWIRWWWRLLPPLLAAIVLLYGVQDAGPSWRAARGDGTPGTFTIEEVQRSRGGCSWRGDFASDDGRIRRADVTLDECREDVPVGSDVRAIDVGSRAAVYPAEGSRQVLIVLVLLVASVVVLAGYLAAAVRWLARR